MVVLTEVRTSAKSAVPDPQACLPEVQAAYMRPPPIRGGDPRFHMTLVSGGATPDPDEEHEPGHEPQPVRDREEDAQRRAAVWAEFGIGQHDLATRDLELVGERHAALHQLRCTFSTATFVSRTICPSWRVTAGVGRVTVEELDELLLEQRRDGPSTRRRIGRSGCTR